jgi:hypothetical protein
VWDLPFWPLKCGSEEGVDREIFHTNEIGQLLLAVDEIISLIDSESVVYIPQVFVEADTVV